MGNSSYFRFDDDNKVQQGKRAKMYKAVAEKTLEI